MRNVANGVACSAAKAARLVIRVVKGLQEASRLYTSHTTGIRIERSLLDKMCKERSMENHIASSLNAAAIRQAEALEQIAKTLASMHSTQAQLMVQLTNVSAAIQRKR